MAQLGSHVGFVSDAARAVSDRITATTPDEMLDPGMQCKAYQQLASHLLLTVQQRLSQATWPTAHATARAAARSDCLTS